jgi:hypothetical protein
VVAVAAQNGDSDSRARLAVAGQWRPARRARGLPRPFAPRLRGTQAGVPPVVRADDSERQPQANEDQSGWITVIRCIPRGS